MSRARSLGKLGNAESLSVTNDNFVGIGSTQPISKLNVSTGEVSIGIGITMNASAGIISATKFYGDGENLENVKAVGLGTALSDDKNSRLNKIYYTASDLVIDNSITVSPPGWGAIAYSQAPDVVCDTGYDLIIDTDREFVVDILGIGLSTL